MSIALFVFVSNVLRNVGWNGENMTKRKEGLKRPLTTLSGCGKPLGATVRWAFGETRKQHLIQPTLMACGQYYKGKWPTKDKASWSKPYKVLCEACVAQNGFVW